MNGSSLDQHAAPPAVKNITSSALEAALTAINPDALSPREALDALYQLKALAAKE